MRKCGLLFLAVMMLYVFSACGDTKNLGNTLAPDRTVAKFSVNVLDESYIDGGSADNIALAVENYEDSVVVSISATGADGLKAMYIELDYDPASYRPAGVLPTDAMASSDDILHLSYLGERGKVHYGQIITDFEWYPGLSGDAEVARAVFLKEPATQIRRVSAAPDSSDSQTTLVEVAPNIQWRNFNQGDYDQNGEVNIADLTPMSPNLGATGCQDDITKSLSVIDGDRNGEINIGDLTPIGSNFKNSTLGGWNVYLAAGSGDVPTSAGDGNGANTLLGNVAVGASTGSASVDRLLFSFDVTGETGFAYVRASDGTNEGIPSNGIELGALPNNDIELNLLTAAISGTGTSLDPYIVNDSTVYNLEVTIDAGATDVTVDGDTVYNVSNSAGAVTKGGTADLDVTDGFTGNFNVRAIYDSETGDNAILFFNVPEPGAGIFIQPVAADADWTGITGDGSTGTPFEWADATEYDLEAFEGIDNTGASIAVGDLDWTSDPPFIVSWPSPGTFGTNTFTSGPVWAFNVDFQSNELEGFVPLSL